MWAKGADFIARSYGTYIIHFPKNLLKKRTSHLGYRLNYLRNARKVGNDADCTLEQQQHIRGRSSFEGPTTSSRVSNARAQSAASSGLQQHEAPRYIHLRRGVPGHLQCTDRHGAPTGVQRLENRRVRYGCRPNGLRRPLRQALSQRQVHRRRLLGGRDHRLLPVLRSVFDNRVDDMPDNPADDTPDNPADNSMLNTLVWQHAAAMTLSQ
ncbi:uncharacterized protein LOC117650814 [Thrips palmi]|uniref:Uncharacterized protein LOC117650814 n=1 Tax=Thrips palmi TaxID=161013 RepID=A0A6P9A045_THRPL|nr:uncharacterized protein LOC117650814 [Thrips palmi]